MFATLHQFVEMRTALWALDDMSYCKTGQSWFGVQGPPWRQPRGNWMVSLVNSHTNATSKRWHLWEIDLRFALNSTPGWLGFRVQGSGFRVGGWGLGVRTAKG